MADSTIISVIVPVFNTAENLNKCIDSILSNTYNDFELILVDDGSTDNSGTICDEYAACDIRIRVIHQVNQGEIAARATGIRLAKGQCEHCPKRLHRGDSSYLGQHNDHYRSQSDVRMSLKKQRPQR